MALSHPANNYKIAKGRAYLARKDQPGQYRYIGNTPELNLSIETEDYEHTSSESGVNEVDFKVPLSVTRSLALVTDNTNAENLALFFFGASAKVTQAEADGQASTFEGVRNGVDSYLKVGITDDNPLGHRNLKSGADAPVVKLKAAAVADKTDLTLTEGLHYEVDLEQGVIQIKSDAPVVGTEVTYQDSTKMLADTIVVEYDVAAHTYERVVSAGTSVEGAVRIVEDNARGDNQTWVLPQVSISPNGDLGLISAEAATVPLTVDIQKPPNSEAVYINGAPLAPAA